MSGSIFKRKIYDDLLDWKTKWHGRRALLIQGARRVGKSTVVEEFAKREYKSYILINFQVDMARVKDLFADGVANLDSFFMSLSLLYGTRLYKRESVIIFDEVQLFPKARESIKQLVADGRYDYLETGSLISIRQNVKDILIPSEERRVNMYPMDFEEFCWARGDTVTVEMVREAFERVHPLGDVVHRKILGDYRLYMAVGGMPQAVEELIASNDLSMVDDVKEGINQLYHDDLKKLDDENGLYTSLIYDAIPSELSSHSRLFKATVLGKGRRLSRELNSFETIQESMIVNTAFACTDPSAGFSLSKDYLRRKIYASDTGLLVASVFGSSGAPIGASVYQQLVLGKLGINLGMVLENAVAQALVSSGHDLYFCAFDRHEIDFLLLDGKKLTPIEVKSSSYQSHKSLDAFRTKYSGRIGNTSYVIYGKDLRKDGEVMYIPFYMSMFL